MISAQMIREDAEAIRRSLERRRAEAPLDEAIEVPTSSDAECSSSWRI